MRALFIAIEGVDFVGKTTIAKAYAERTGSIYYKTPPEPFGTMLKGREFKGPTERLEFFARATLHASEEIRRLLAAGSGVVADRWIWTTAAYHLAKDASLRPRAESAIRDSLAPDASIYLQISDERLWRERAAGCGGARTANDREILADAALRSRIHDLYLALNPGFRRVENDGTPGQAVDAIERLTSK